MTAAPMSPAEYGAHLARQAPPLTEAQIEGAARILASVEPNEQEQQHPRVA